MVVTWGRAAGFTGSTKLDQYFEICLGRCLNMSSCVVVSSNTAGSCLMFRLDQISTVERLDISYGSKVAIKTTFEYEPSCPSGSEEPLISGSTSSGDTYLNDAVYQEYAIGYSSPLWTFSTTKTISCPSTDWKLFFRPLGPWCIGVFISSAGITKKEAAGQCATTEGGVLTAIQTKEEYTYIYNRIILLATNVKPTASRYTTTGVWLGGQRKESCMFPNTPSGACNGTNEFDFGDLRFQLPGYYPWDTDQPSGISFATDENCILLARTGNKLSMDDNKCNETSPVSTMLIRGNVCGVLPTIS